MGEKEREHRRVPLLALIILVLAMTSCDTDFEPPQRSEIVSSPPPTEPSATSIATNVPTEAIPATQTSSVSVVESPEPTVILPTLRATPTQLPQLRVIYASINVRSGPGTNYDPIAYLYENDIVTVLDVSPDGYWYQVNLEENIAGWVSAEVVELAEDTVIIVEATSDDTTDPSPTPSPSPTSDVTSTPVPPLFVEVFNVSEYPASDGSLWLFGEVRNPGTLPAKDIDVNATLYSESGAVTAAESSYLRTPLEFSLWFTGVLYPGEKAPFKILIGDPGEWNSWKITATYAEAKESDFDDHYRDLKIVNDLGRPIDEYFDNYRISGEIENTGNLPTGPVRIVITLYNEDGMVIGAEDEMTYDFDSTVPGQTIPFSIDFYARGDRCQPCDIGKSYQS